MSRLAVPADLKRRLYREAGYRCSIPTCRGTSSLQMEHIDTWAKVKEHRFENMIVLCANCHGRVTKGEISKAAVKTYKQNLAIINGRYSLFELRIMERFFELGAQAPVEDIEVVTVKQYVVMSWSDQFHLKGLIDDGFVNFTPMNNNKIPLDPDYPNKGIANLTKFGVKFVNNFFDGKEIE